MEAMCVSKISSRFNLKFFVSRFFCTVIEFLKLEKVEIGGLKGRQLSLKITAIYFEFNQYFTAFASKTYDVLDPDDPTFNKDFEVFQERILELDMKLAAILCQAFDDCHNLESVFKLISIVGSVLDRPKIKQEFTNKYSEILMMLDEEMTTCEDIYDHQMAYRAEKGYLFVDRSFPTTTSALRWVRQLGARISAPIKNFQSLRHPISKSDQANSLYTRHDVLLKKLGLFEEEALKEWTVKVPGQIESNLKKSLIDRRRGDGALVLNFSPELFAILREVHYLTLMGKEGIPEEGIKFAENNDLYRNFTLNLDKTIEWYNRVRFDIERTRRERIEVTHRWLSFQIVQKSTRVELELIKTEIRDIDKAVEIGINELTWNSSSQSKMWW